jgi:hypothetical protein
MLSISGKPVTVSHHAIQRMRERFRLSFAAYNWESNKLTNELILRELGKAHQCIKWKLVPFYTNMMSWKFKFPTEVYKCGSVFYILNEEPTRYVVATVVRNWWCE